MKHYYFLAFALFALALASCNEERELEPWEIQMNDIEQKIGDNPAGPEEMAQFMADLKKGVLVVKGIGGDRCGYKDGKCTLTFDTEEHGIYGAESVCLFLDDAGMMRIASRTSRGVNVGEIDLAYIYNLKINGESSTTMEFGNESYCKERGSYTAILEYYKAGECIIRGMLPRTASYEKYDYLIYRLKVNLDPEVRTIVEEAWERGEAYGE